MTSPRLSRRRLLGAVRSPSRYTLPAGAHVADLIEVAGGVLTSADLTRVNLTATLADGQSVYVPLAERAAAAAAVQSQCEHVSSPGELRNEPYRRATIETAARLVRCLGEEQYTSRLHLLRSTRLVGPELALELLDEALRIDGDGGELLPSGGRYRTPGGIYFRLVRELLTPAEWAQVTCSSARSTLVASNGENPTC